MFDGIDNYVEVGGSLLFSVATTGALTVSVWMMPEVLTFIHSVKGYVHWLGKGTGFGNSGQQEWTFRMYDFANDANRPNRISFYVFNPEGHLGVGSYYQDRSSRRRAVDATMLLVGNPCEIFQQLIPIATRERASPAESDCSMMGPWSSQGRRGMSRQFIDE